MSVSTQFGDSLVLSSDDYKTVTPSEVLDGKDYVMVYFSAHWCPPCRNFTPKLIQLYKTYQSSEASKTESMELVFCSLDKDEAEYKDYTSTMPWYSLPFSSPFSQTLARKYKAQGIPHLVILDGKTGDVITMKGVEEVMGDPKGANFPWKPLSLGKILPEKVIAPKGSEEKMMDVSSLDDKYLMLYFSAHWCPPCKAFTPTLSKAYTKLKANDKTNNFELLFISSDRDQTTFDEYHSEMTFGALPYEARDAKSALSSRFDVSGIPTLIMLSPVTDKETGERTLINDNVRSYIMSDELEEFPFYPKNYGSVSSADDLNEKKCVIAFYEQGDDEEQEELINIMKEAASNNQDVNYYWSMSPGGLGEKIRKITNMTEMKEEPEMMILDIPDEGGYYTSTETSLSVETIQEFVNNPGDRKQLS